jgi:hypothetical protein
MTISVLFRISLPGKIHLKEHRQPQLQGFDTAGRNPRRSDRLADFLVAHQESDGMLTTRFGESGTVQEDAETGRENANPKDTRTV